MAMNYTDEEYHQMTLEECFQEEVTPNLFGVSMIFTEARRNMTLAEYKAFALALSHHRWDLPCPDTLYLEKKEVAKAVGINSDIDHLSVDLMRSIGEMPKHSFLKFADKDKDIYVNGCFVITIASFRNRVRIRLNPDYLGLFGCLDGKESRYITMWSGDIFKMNSERAIKFYELLRENSDTREAINSGTVSIRKFKEMFDIPKEGKGSYMRSRQNGGFDRNKFEKQVIDPVCEELAKTDMIRLILQPDGKYYQKEKKGNRVNSYKFFWTIKDSKAQLEEKEEALAIEEAAEDRELWESALEEFNFSREELDAIKSYLILVPQSYMLSNGAAPGSIDLDRYHFMEQRAKEIAIRETKISIGNKCKYLIKMLENDYIPKAGGLK